MSELIVREAAVRAAPSSALSLSARRAVFWSLVGLTMAGVMALLTLALSAGGFSAVDYAIIALFLLTLLAGAIGFWNAVIGFAIMRFTRDPVAVVTPAAARVRGDEPVTASVALLVFVRNEMPARVIRNLTPTLQGLADAGVGRQFHLYVLSDTSIPDVAAAEQQAFARLAESWRGRIAVTYRRRETNTGFKAGNLHDFCARWGSAHDLAVTFDTDSYIPAAAVLRMVRIMQASPEIGILQGMVIGMPTTSAFARIFQFGMRLRMRSYTIGSAWWQGDCGPHWGHNSVLRLRPFAQHCQLPPLPRDGPLGGHILSHDQLEAVLMRRAGYEVRVLPDEDLGWEENPPTLLEFIRRDLRWCQGNMQYKSFLSAPGLKPVSRYQLVFALLMFVGSPAWIGLLLLGTLGAVLAPEPAAFVHADYGYALLAVVLLMLFAPKIASVVDVLTRPAMRRGFGGAGRFLVSVAAETGFFLLLSPIMWLSHTRFLAGLLFGRAIGWIGQTRDDHAVSWRIALRHLWPHTLVGVAPVALLSLAAPQAIPYVLLVAAGLTAAVPLAVLTADPRVGAMLARLGLGSLPEEWAPSALDPLALPALQGTARAPATRAAEMPACSSG